MIGGYQVQIVLKVVGPGRQQHASNEYLDQLMRVQTEQERLDEVSECERRDDCGSISPEAQYSGKLHETLLPKY
jgi:hypothetical protein